MIGQTGCAELLRDLNVSTQEYRLRHNPEERRGKSKLVKIAVNKTLLKNVACAMGSAYDLA